MSVVFSILPIVLLFVLMLCFKMAGHKSALITLIVTILIALFLPNQFGFAPDGYEQSGVWWAVLEGFLKATFPILIIILMDKYIFYKLGKKLDLARRL